MDVTLSVEFLGQLTGKDPGELSEALKNGEELKPSEDIQSYLSSVIGEKLKVTRKAGYDEGHGRGTRESLTNLEKQLAEEWEIPYEKGKTTVKDLTSAYLEKNQKPGSGSTKLTPELIKASDVYRNDLKALMDQKAALENEFVTFKTNTEKEKVLGVAKSKAMALFEKHSFKLPENQKIRENAISGFMMDLTKNVQQFKLNDDGNDITEMIGSNGVPLEDAMMNKIGFEDHVVNTAKGWFEIVKSDGRQSPGAGSQTGGGGAGDGLPVVKTKEEFFREIRNVPVDKQMAFKEKYEPLLQG